MVKIIETGKSYVVKIDEDLIPLNEFDWLNKKKKVQRWWGIDNKGQKWTSHVFYPKGKYSKEKMESEILQKFENCPHCRTSIFYNDPEIDELEEGIIKPKEKNSYMKKYKNALIATTVISAGIISGIVALKIYNNNNKNTSFKF